MTIDCSKPIPRLLCDGQETPIPAAANPFIFKRGLENPDEPPEAAHILPTRIDSE